MPIYLDGNNITGGFTAEEKKQFNNSIKLINEQMQTKTDNNLTTTSKEVVGAINEVKDKANETISNPTELDINKYIKNGFYSIGDATKRTNLPIQKVGTLLVYYAGHYVIQEYILNENLRRFMRRSTDKGANWSAWQELATMDKVEDGYAKIIKNDDTDTNDAMFIAYKNRDLFGIRIYKDDDSEHELRFNASDISYVKNGVMVWATRVADVPNTVIVSENTKVKLNSNCYYTVINGVCYVTLWGFTCTEAGKYVVNSSMPKTKLTMNGVCAYGSNGYEGGCAYVLHDGNGNNKLYIEARVLNETLYGSFSYPVEV